MPLLMQSAVLLKQRYKSDTLRHSLLQTAQNADHQLAPHVQGDVCLYLRILELWNYPVAFTFLFQSSFLFSSRRFVAVSVITSFLTLSAFLLCFYSHCVFIFFLFRSISLDFGVAASSVNFVVLWDIHRIVCWS